MKYAITSLTLILSFAIGCAPSAEIGERPYSLHGTVPDGELRADEGNHFIPDSDAFRFFDYYLTANGEIPDHTLNGLIIDELERQLPATAAAEATSIFTRYIEYRQEAAALLQDSAAPEEQVMAQLRRLHAESVGDIPGLANEPLRFERAFAMRAVLSDRSASPAERSAAIARIEATMVPAGEALAEAEATHASRMVLELREAEARLASQGAGSVEEIQALRTSIVGSEAAERLAALDRSRAEWQGRVRAYQQERAAIEAQMPASAEREQALAMLLASRFDAREQLRIHAAVALLPSNVNTY